MKGSFPRKVKKSLARNASKQDRSSYYGAMHGNKSGSKKAKLTYMGGKRVKAPKR